MCDTTQIRIQYDLVYQLDTLSGDMEREDRIVLDIGAHSSKCYSYYTQQSDSLLSSPKGRAEWSRLFKAAIRKSSDGIPSGFPHRRSTFVIYKDLISGSTTVYDFISDHGYFYQDSLQSMQWELSEVEPRSLYGHDLQCASTHWRGRRWVAWFAPDVPVDNGPWKFGGLPGLIFETYDEGDHYHFTLVGIERGDGQPICRPSDYGPYGEKRPYRETSRISFLRDKRKYVDHADVESIAILGDAMTDLAHPYDFAEVDYR